jgi:NAD+ synthase
MSTCVRFTPEVIKFRNVEGICAKLEDLIRTKVEALQRNGVIIGLSGGLDSTIVTYLCARSVGPRNVLALYMPDRDSKLRHKEDAMSVANELGVKFRVRELTPILDAFGIYRSIRGIALMLGKSLLEKFRGQDLLVTRASTTTGGLLANGIAYSDIKHRLRATMLFYYAELENLLVVGAGTKTEYVAGAFCQWGCDHLADVMPLHDMYYTQEKQLAEYLGVPERIVQKAPDPDILPGIDNMEKLYGAYETIDLVSYGLEHHATIKELYDQFGKKQVDRIIALMENSKHMRESPYVSNLST